MAWCIARCHLTGMLHGVVHHMVPSYRHGARRGASHGAMLQAWCTAWRIARWCASYAACSAPCTAPCTASCTASCSAVRMLCTRRARRAAQHHGNEVGRGALSESQRARVSNAQDVKGHLVSRMVGCTWWQDVESAVLVSRVRGSMCYRHSHSEYNHSRHSHSVYNHSRHSRHSHSACVHAWAAAPSIVRQVYRA